MGFQVSEIFKNNFEGILTFLDLIEEWNTEDWKTLIRKNSGKLYFSGFLNMIYLMEGINQLRKNQSKMDEFLVGFGTAALNEYPAYNTNNDFEIRRIIGL